MLSSYSYFNVTFDHDVDKQGREVQGLSAIIAETHVPVPRTESRHGKHSLAQQAAIVFKDSDSQAG